MVGGLIGLVGGLDGRLVLQVAEVEGVYRAKVLLLVFSFFFYVDTSELAGERFVSAVEDGVVVSHCQQLHRLLKGDPSFRFRMVSVVAVSEVGPFEVPGHEPPGDDEADEPCVYMVVQTMFTAVSGKGILDIGDVPPAEGSFGELTAFLRAFDRVQELLQSLVVWRYWSPFLVLLWSPFLVSLLTGGTLAAGGSGPSVWCWFFEFHLKLLMIKERL